MKNIHLLTVLAFVFFSACSSTNSSTSSQQNFPPQRPAVKTVAQQIEMNPDAAESYSWIEETEKDSVYIIVDDFPSLVNGLRGLHNEVSWVLSRDETSACSDQRDQRIIYEVLINKNGRTEKVNTTTEVSAACTQLIWGAVISQRREPGKVDGKPVTTLYNIPIKI